LASSTLGGRDDCFGVAPFAGRIHCSLGSQANSIRVILGRPTNLWNAALGGLLNAVVYFHVLGLNVDVAGLAILNVVLYGFIGLVSNTANSPNTPNLFAGKPAP
jgi:hypothetical protein